MVVNNSLLYSALKKAIDNHGIDILESPQLANVLSDYGAFDVHDAEMATKKEIISTLVKAGYWKKLFRWKGKNENYNWENENKKFIENFIRKHSFANKTVDDITNDFICVVGLTPVFKPIKTRKSWAKLLLGKDIKFQRSDKYAILVSSVTMSLMGLLPLIDNPDGGLVYGISLMAIHFCAWIFPDNPLTKKNTGASITWASLIFELITIVSFVVIAESDIEISAFVVFVIVSVICFYLTSRFSKTNRWKLIGLNSMIMSMILLVIFNIPLSMKHIMVQDYKKPCLESIEMRDKHLQQNIELGFMGIGLGDSYANVLNKMKTDTNVVCQIKRDKESYAFIDYLDDTEYRKNYFVLSGNTEFSFDKELQYDISFDNDTVRLSLFFIHEELQYIRLIHKAIDLYIKKYGAPEKYYTKKPEEYITRCSHYPYYKKKTTEIEETLHYPKELKDALINDYSPILQWTFSTGVIRINSFSTQYIATKLLDSINQKVKQEKEQREIERRQQEYLDSITQMNKEQQERDSILRKEQEKKRFEEIHKNAINQI